LVPYGAAIVGIWGPIGLEHHVQAQAAGAALALQILVAAALVSAPRWDHRRWAGTVVIIVFLASVALLFIPIVAIGGARYPVSGWRLGGLTVVVAAVIGVTVLALAERQRRDLQQLRALASGLPHGCFVLFDTNLRYLMAGGPALSHFEQTPADLEGRTVREVYPPAIAARLESRFRAALAGEEQRWEVTSRGREYDLRAVPVRDADGRVFGGAVVTVDVTERVQRHAEHQALSRVATAVATGAKPETVFGAVAGEVAELFAATVAGVVRFEESTRVGRVVGGWAASGGAVGGEEIDLDGTSAAAMVYRTGAPVRIEACPSGPRDPVVVEFALSGAVCAPISIGGTVWGSIGASFSGVRVPEGAENRLARFGELVAVAVANAEAWDALARQAATDSVTGLANHRAFYDHLRAEVERAHRHDRSLSVALFDLDHFKQINDGHGHQAGDKVLAEVARRLADRSRATAWLLGSARNSRG
jgi:GAF domain-containing protein/PAS domain-containing protein